MGVIDLEVEIAFLKKSLLEKDKLIEELRFENERLREQLNNHLRHRFGQRSEKHLLGNNNLSKEFQSTDLEFENISYKRKKRKSRKDKLSEDLPRQKIYYDLPEDLRICRCGCGKQLRKMGEEITEQLVVVPEQISYSRYIHK